MYLTERPSITPIIFSTVNIDTKVRVGRVTAKGRTPSFFTILGGREEGERKRERNGEREREKERGEGI
jgi:hypothetical protein